jgi:hypothetical protein
MASKRTPRPDRGSVSAAVVVLTMVFIVCSGLVLDGGRLVAARSSAASDALDAARAGSQSLHRLREGLLEIEPALAVARARAHLDRIGAGGEVRADARRVVVTVSTSVDPLILGIFGVGRRVVRVTRSAEPFDS